MERLLKKGYEVLFLVEPVDEYCIQSLPEFEGKKFQNVAKEGLTIDDSEKAKERKEAMEKEYEPLTKWLQELDSLKEKISKATVSDRLTKSPCALVASTYGWSGNMERIMRSQAYAKQQDPSQQWVSYTLNFFFVQNSTPILKASILILEIKYDKRIFFLQILLNPEENFRNQPQTSFD